MARWCGWKDDVTGYGALQTINPEEFGGYGKNISSFIQYLESLRVRMLVDHVGIVMGVGYSIGHVFVPLWQTFTKITPLFWGMDFGHVQTHVDVQASEASLFGNREVREKFDVDDHYIRLASNRPLPSFRIVVDCHEGYMLILQLGDETYAKSLWVARTLSKSIFATSSPYFWQIQVECHRPTTWNEDVIRHYTG